MAAVTLLNAVTQDSVGQPLDCTNKKIATFRITGTFNADVVFEASLDGVDYFPYTGRPDGAKSLVGSVSAPGFVTFDVEPIAYLRPRVVRYQSGAVTVTAYAEVKPDALLGYAHFNAVTTGTLIKSGVGVLHSVNIGDAGSGMVVTIYDGTSTAGQVIGVLKTAGAFIYDVQFTTGLYIVISAATMGDVTVVYK